MASDSTKTAEHLHIEHLVRTKIPQGAIYAFLLEPVVITNASKDYCVARLLLNERHMNSQKSLHGSVSATIIDWMGGMAIATHDLRAGTGVSVDIHVTYQSGAKLGEEIEIEGIAERVGGNLAYTRVNLFKVQDGKRGSIIVSGTHTKFVKGSESKKQ
ncbi:hypothetical protein M409DRAFT_35201 [Zasmidium cellare ATCC 36951]|uniref:Thioesterase domain-containing protein n=1 Tax=Zasmidium cellare ATCC 36951 TaxID=1080233 RepID=A0A6A6D448_ZASCE|nr:uncharacterized protein M409DRAFT_35201 [Zasmidium cellare ATCC 36951]KAF2174191.1 hypothetical protein M409DRAFT_35201 [Zasmidium cellare ATCC 36951]